MLTWPLPGNSHAHATPIAALGQVNSHPSAGAGHTEMTSPELSGVGMAALTTPCVPLFLQAFGMECTCT